jgi:hypothetical protein
MNTWTKTLKNYFPYFLLNQILVAEKQTASYMHFFMESPALQSILAISTSWQPDASSAVLQLLFCLVHSRAGWCANTTK